MKTEFIKSAAGLLAEVISVSLPVLVIWLGSSEYGISVAASPEWAVGAIILFGQACVKFTTSIASVKSSKGPMSLILVSLVAGLVVSCYLLVRATQLEQQRKMCEACDRHQVEWFIFGVTVYLALGLLCDIGLAAGKND